MPLREQNNHHNIVLHCKALGLVFVALLLSSLAEIPSENYNIPQTDEDSLQRLIGDIFKNDIDEFRYYCDAEQIWSPLVSTLDENGRAGWNLLDKMLNARQNVSEKLKNDRILTAESLLSSPFLL